ncbi:hypothetical protein [Brevibacillus reuszeri]|uniref:hypothetical protein n=1 Tax=Brevibacillus reuszeri TaxID=54915 RepID=UPI003D234A12
MINENVSNDVVSVVPIAELITIKSDALSVVETVKVSASNICLTRNQYQHFMYIAEQLFKTESSSSVVYEFEIDRSQESGIVNIDIVVQTPTVIEYQRVVRNITNIFAPTTTIVINVKREGVTLRGKVDLSRIGMKDITETHLSNQFTLSSYLPTQFHTNRTFYVMIENGEIKGFSCDMVGDKKQ